MKSWYILTYNFKSKYLLANHPVEPKKKSNTQLVVQVLVNEG